MTVRADARTIDLKIGVDHQGDYSADQLRQPSRRTAGARIVRRHAHRQAPGQALHGVKGEVETA